MTTPAVPSIDLKPYGTMPDGRPVTEYTLDNGAGLRLSAINLGGIVTALEVPDRSGAIANVVLGLPTLADYLASNPHFGTIVGRYANRIAQGRFTLDGEAFRLPVNDGPNSMHGGNAGFGKRWWDVAPVDTGVPGEVALALRYTSDGSAPTAASRPVIGPIAERGLIRVAAFDRNGRPGVVASVDNP